MNKKAYLYVFDTMADWEISYITAELNSGRYFKKLNEYIPVITAANTSDTIKSMGGLQIKPDILIENLKIEQNDILILPGGETWLEDLHSPILKIAKHCFENNILTAAICGATIALAQKGLLNYCIHTSNDLGYLKTVCPKYTGEKNYRNESAVTDKKIITASGIAPLEFAYQILKKLDVFNPETLKSWYELYKTKESKCFFALMESLKNRC